MMKPPTSIFKEIVMYVVSLPEAMPYVGPKLKVVRQKTMRRLTTIRGEMSDGSMGSQFAKLGYTPKAADNVSDGSLSSQFAMLGSTPEAADKVSAAGSGSSAAASPPVGEPPANARSAAYAFGGPGAAAKPKTKAAEPSKQRRQTGFAFATPKVEPTGATLPKAAGPKVAAAAPAAPEAKGSANGGGDGGGSGDTNLDGKSGPDRHRDGGARIGSFQLPGRKR